MKSVQVRISREVRGVAPTAALAWWSDFRDGHADHPFLPGQRRRILAQEGGRVVMEDRGPLWRERTTAWVEADRVRFEGENAFSRFQGAYIFEATRDGAEGTMASTRVRLDAEVELRGVYRLGSPIVRPLLIADLRAHLREMRRELAGG